MLQIHVRILLSAYAGAPAYPQGTNVGTLVKLIKDTNVFLKPAGIELRFDPATDLEIVDNVVFHNDQTAPDNLQIAYARMKDAMAHSDRLTMIFRDGPNRIADNYGGGDSYYLVINKGEMSNPSLLAHELGHYLHLNHTFASEVTKCEAEKRIYTFVEVEGHDATAGLQALDIYDGDNHNVKDTPRDLGARIFGTHAVACSSNPVVTLNVTFPPNARRPHAGQNIPYTYVPLTRNNLMSYFFNCNLPKGFSPDQNRAMLRALKSGNRRRLIDGAAWDSAKVQDTVSPAAVSRHENTVVVYATDANGTVHSRVWDAARNTYWPADGKWLALGEPGYAGLVAHARRPDTIDLIANVINGNMRNKVWNEEHGSYYPANDAWSEALGVRDRESLKIESRAAVVSRQPHQLDLFVRLVDGGIAVRSWDKNWSPDWDLLGGEGAGAPAAVARKKDVVDIFARWSDGTIRSKVWHPDVGNWYPSKESWLNLGGRGYDSPAVVARRNNILDLYTRWSDGTIRSKVWHQGQDYWPSRTGWFNLGGEATCEPVALSRNPTTIMLAVRWADGSIRTKVWDDSRGDYWPSNTGWDNIGGQTVGRPALVARGAQHVIIYARFQDGSIRTKVWNQANQQWWPSQFKWHSLGTP